MSKRERERERERESERGDVVNRKMVNVLKAFRDACLKNYNVYQRREDICL